MSHLRNLLCTLLALFISAASLHAIDPVFISEFEASNQTGLTDEDGATSDWIEIFNSGTTTVNLAGWRLTDNSGDLSKWIFPAVSLDPKGYLIVFASGKNRIVPTAPLHTNFKLSSGGGYLALVKADGSIAHEYNPYPAQYDDKPYGFQQTVTTTSLVSPTASLKWLVPTSASPSDATWSARTFTDTLWTTGLNGVGFESTVSGFAVKSYLSNQSIPSLTQAESVISTPSLQSSVVSGTRSVINYDNDNGGSPGHYSAEVAPPGLSGGNDNFVVEAIGTITIPTAGVWSFCVTSDDGCQLQLRPVGGSYLSPTLNYPGLRGMGDTLISYTLAAGDYDIRAVIFENGGGAGGEVSAKQGSWGSWDSGFKLIGDTANGGLAVKSVPVGSTGSGYSQFVGAGSNTKAAMFDAVPQQSSAYIRYHFTNPGGLTSLTMPIRYDDGFVAYLNGTEIARRNAPAGTPGYSSVASSDRLPAQAQVQENVDLTPYLGSLVAGSNNILAIHGLNQAASNGDFLVKAELYQYTITTSTTPTYFTTATPGGFNTAVIYNKVSPVTSTGARGFFTTPQTVTLTTGTAGATIRYTLDGSSPFQLDIAGNMLRDGTNNPIPSPTSGVYSTPLTVSQTTTLRYAAFKTGYDPSDSVTQTFIFLSDVINQSASAAAGSGPAPSITNPSGASPAVTTWPTTVSSGQVLDYGMDPNIVGVAPYNATIINDLQTIPSFSIVTDIANLFDPSIGIYANPGNDTSAWERPASLELIYPNGATGFQVNCGLRIRGGFSRSTTNPKHAFRIFMDNAYGLSSLNYPFFGSDPSAVTSFAKFDIRCAENYSWSFQGDRGNGLYFRDEFNRQTQLDMGEPSSHTAFFHLYLNGQYWGLYNIDERPEANFGASYFGGNASDYDTIKVAPDNGYTIFATDGNMDAWTSLWLQADLGLASTNTETVNNAQYQKLLGNNPDGTPNATYPVLLDATNLVDYMICIYWGGNLDAAISNFLSNAAPNNWYGIRDRTGAHGGFRFVLHDSEHTLLDVNADRLGPWPAGSSAQQGAATALSKSSPQYIFQQCIYAQEFQKMFADRVFKHYNYNGALTPAAATARFDAMKAQVDRAIVGESARWGDAQTEPAINRDTDWIAVVNNVRNNFLPGRTAVSLAQFRAKGWYPSIDPPLWSQRGGTVAPGTTITLSLVSGQSGTIYYTTDGSDPRAFGGGVNAGATVYAGPITIASSKTIRTRVKSGTTWSAMDEATFYTTQNYTGLALTEINYNPLPNGAVNGDNFEFLELKNTTANSMDLGGLTFSNGLTYTFPPGSILAPGAFWVLARDTSAGQATFHTRYPGVTVNGIYSGKLSNGGETITILGPTGGLVLSVAFSDSAPWPAAADGNGFSAVPSGTIYNSDDGHNWRASANPGGSPGADDPAVNFPPIVINEVLTNSGLPLTDTIELYNPTGAAVNVGNWWLTDDSNVPKKYQIAAGTMIPAGGYISFDESQFNPTPGTAPSFALNSAGDDVYLFSGDGSGNITGYTHGFSFKGAESNVSFGRYLNSVGDETFPRQISRTFGAVNSGPLVGPLVISEIMYHPYDGFDEYVEIRNIGANTVNLYDPANPTHTWKVSGVDYFFPQGQSIPAGGTALVVPIDPATFRTKYNVPAQTQIFGPYNTIAVPASLDNGGERVSLEMPDTPVLQGGVFVTPYDVIDSVRYNDKAPWPLAADGGGPSLQRISLSAYADDPVNWYASGSTPGTDNASNIAPSVTLTSPANNASVVVPANVTFQASASDTDGTILKVEYYVDGGKVGESSTGPAYSYVWAATGGIHSLVAKAIDNSLAVTTSAPITLYATSPVSQGLKAQYFVHAENFTVGPAGIRIDPTVNFSVNTNWPATTGFPGITVNDYSVRWTGQVRAPSTGTYTFYINSDDGSFLYLNGVQVINDGGYHGDQELSYTTNLIAGQLYPIQMDMFQGYGGATAQLSWSGPGISKQIIPQSALYPDGAPIIITQPVGLTREVFTSATFTVFSSGTAPLSYQWRKGGVNIAGATSATLALPYLLQSDAGQYSVLVSNSSGFAVSANATLTVTFTDTDGDGMQNAWEIANGFNPNSPADASLDADGDGKTNLQEFLAGTDPRNPNSRFALTIAKPVSGPGCVLSFTAQPYKSYSIQYINPLSTGTWTKLTDIDISSTSRSIQFTDTTAGSNTARFYRVITPKQ